MKDLILSYAAKAGNHSTTYIQIISIESQKILVLKELKLEKYAQSLTNSIEIAIEQVFRQRVFTSRMGSQYIKDEWKIFQDCGEEGIFRVTFDIERRGGLTTNGGGPFEGDHVVNPQWKYFSKDIKTILALYGKT